MICSQNVEIPLVIDESKEYSHKSALNIDVCKAN